ncbi:protein of unknown function [Neorhodopirellula lusitana]|uniref:GYF domain-containing protein n=1 Tax=Neorhodopirellula lusitana TaxID=445327 RepID=A0ABY1PMU7_9BACT|nr:DUF4339 domain-containing protein [Neorhodopirellula lusitana]SMP38009.1 protein of unknown function [Neorhodopirellula lusitana]
MGVRFACHACGKRLNIKTELAGRRGICPACSVRFRIPAYDTEFSTPVQTEESVPIGDSVAMAGALADSTNGTEAGDAGMLSEISSGDGSATNVVRQNSAKVGQRESAVDSQTGHAQAGDAPLAGQQPESAQSSISSMPEHASSPPQPAVQEGFGGPTATWYVRPPTGGQYGPADGPTMEQWMKEGRIAQNAMVWRDGWKDWREASETLSTVSPAGSVGSQPVPGVPLSNGDAQLNGGVQLNGGLQANTGVQAGGDALVNGVASGTAGSDPGKNQIGDSGIRTNRGALGSNKKKRSKNRIVASVVLGLVLIALLAALVVVITRG